jgi:hypothetical protein
MRVKFQMVDFTYTKSLRFPLGMFPFLVFDLERALDPGDRDGGPEASPQEREDPTDLA